MGKAELTASILHIARFLKSGIPIDNSKVPNTAARKKKEEGEENVMHSTKTQKLSFGAKILNLRMPKPGLIIS